MGDPTERPDPVGIRQASPARQARLALLAQACGALAAGWIGWSLTGALAPALVAGFLAPVLIHGAILAVGFAMAWLVAESPRDPAIRWIGTWLREWPRSMRVVYGLLAWQEGFPTPAAGGRAQRQPIVLIHCFAGHRGIWSVSAPWFASRGHPLVIPSFTPADGDIDAHVEPLRAAISRATDLADDPTAPVHLVAHSMGGLIARAYLRRYGWDRIGAVVTLGTPHGGTPQAWFGAGLAARQMRPRSAWLRRLAGEEPLPPPRQMVTVISRQDNITAAASRQTVPLARQIRLGGLGHMSYVFEPRIIDLVLRILAGVERHWQAQRAFTGYPHGNVAVASTGLGGADDLPARADAVGPGQGRAEPQWIEPGPQAWTRNVGRRDVDRGHVDQRDRDQRNLEQRNLEQRVEPWLDDGSRASPQDAGDSDGVAPDEAPPDEAAPDDASSDADGSGLRPS